MKKILIVITLLNLMFLSGCGYKEGVVTSNQKTYLYFTGDVNGAKVSIDKGEMFSVKAGKNNKYSINTGKHLVEIYKNGSLIVKREIFTSDGISKEIKVQY